MLYYGVDQFQCEYGANMDSGRRLSDQANGVGITVHEHGAHMLRVCFTSFAGPVSVEMVISRKTSRKAFQEFIRSIQEDEEVYLDLIAQYKGEPPFNPDSPEPVPLRLVERRKAKTKISAKPGGIRERILTACPRCGSRTKDQICQNYGCEAK